MPSKPPRTSTIQKRDQLAKREQELTRAIRTAVSGKELLHVVESVRAAQLALLKAELHWAEDARIGGDDVKNRINNIQRDQRIWSERSPEEIIQGYIAD